MRPQARRLSCFLALVCGSTLILPVGCGPTAAPDGSQNNVTIPKDVAEKQNEAYKNASKQSKKGKPPGM